jgi:hypothetical protein
MGGRAEFFYGLEFKEGKWFLLLSVFFCSVLSVLRLGRKEWGCMIALFSFVAFFMMMTKDL